jgi:hypothetical protein
MGSKREIFGPALMGWMLGSPPLTTREAKHLSNCEALIAI